MLYEQKWSFRTIQTNTTYNNKRYETIFNRKNNFSELNSNYEVARKHLFCLNNTFKWNENLYFKYRQYWKQVKRWLNRNKLLLE